MRFFLIGAGAIAREHAKAIGRLKLDSIELHVADVRPDAAAALAGDFPGTVAHLDLQTMLALPAREDDIVIVATPVFAHCENTIAGLRSGRHVLCEKPLAFNDEQATRMLGVAREMRRRLGCCSSRFGGTDLTQRLRTALNGKKLGDLYHVTWRSRQRRGRTGIDYQPQTTWFVNRSMSGGGVLMDWGPYDISLLSEILSPTQATIESAWVSTPMAIAPNHPPVIDVEFHAAAEMRWQTPFGIVRLTYERSSCTHGPDGSAFLFEGTRAAAVYDWLNWGESNRLTITGEDAQGAVVGEKCEEPMGAIHDRPVQGFVQAIHGAIDEPVPLVADERAVFNFQVIQAIYRSAELGTPQMVRLNHSHQR